MSTDTPLIPDPYSPSPKPRGPAPIEQTLDEIQRELRLLSARMDRVEVRLGIPSQLAPPLPKASASADPGANSATPTPLLRPDAATAPPPLPDPLPGGAAFTPPATTPPIPPFVPPPVPKPLTVPTSPEPAASLPLRLAQSQPAAATTSPRDFPDQSSASAYNPTTNTGSFGDSVGVMRDRVADSVTQKRLIGDWENLIGGKWALWVGLFCLFLAVASFLAYTWKSLPPAPPSVRFALGLAAGAILIGAASYFRTRTQRWFSEGLAGAGLAVLYLCIWAGAQQYHLLSFGTAFTAMGFTTGLGVYLAIHFDALSLSILATLGGFLTPLLLQAKAAPASAALSGESLSLLTYVAVLNAGILAVSLFKRWNSLTWLSFIATLILVGAWSFDHYSEAQRWPMFAYFTIYFLLFVGTACFYSLARREQTAQPDLLLLFGVTSVYALAGHALLDGALGAVPGTLAIDLALFFGFLCGAVRTLAPENEMLRQSAGGIALLFLTVAVPIQFQGQGLAIGWSVEAGVLLILGLRLRAALLQRAGQIVWCLSFVPLLGVLSEVAPNPHTLFLNERALPLLLSLLATALVVAQHWSVVKTASDASNDTGRKAGDSPVLLDSLAPLYASYVVLGGAWLIAQEAYLWFTWNKWPTSGTWHAGALYTISSIGALYAVVAFAIGMKGRDLSVCMSAMAVMALAMMAPVWTGVAFSTQGWTPFWNLRWSSYIVIALALAVLDWMINRDQKTFPAGEAEAMELWPASVSLFALVGITIEVYSSFAHGIGSGGHPTDLQWRGSAFLAITILWSVYATATLYLSYGWRQSALRMTAFAVGSAGSLLLLIASIAYNSLDCAPLFNLRALAFAVTVGLLGVIASWENRRTRDDSNTTSQGIAPVSAYAALLSTCLLLWGLTQESYGVFEHFRNAFGAHWNLIAFFAISVLWSAGMWVLLRIGLLRNLIPFRAAAYSLFALSSVLLLWTASDATQLGWTPLLNARWVAFVVVALLMGSGSSLLGRYRSNLTEWEEQIAAMMGWFAGILLLWGITQEAYETCFYFRRVLGSYWLRWAQMVISVAWSVYGAALLVGGINRNYQPLRLAALGLLAITVLKVFVFDLGFLSGPLRMFSLAGLGLALIFISWLYGRYARSSDDDLSPIIITE